MTNVDPYRKNWADDVEQLAVDVVTTWAGSTGTVRHTGKGSGPDFRIDYTNKRQGVGEVGWHEDPVIRKMWAARSSTSNTSG